jgi:circadian clock protein KaiC
MDEQITRGRSQEGGETVRVTTGVPGLDLLLNGGLRQGGLHVILGDPGAGKSVLAHQIASHRIRQGGKVLYLTALVEAHQTLISQARTFTFFDPGVVPDSFYYASLYPMLAKGGLKAVREEISRLVAHHDPSLVILDGVHALKFSGEKPLEYQRFMHEMEAQASVMGLTTLLLAHPPTEGVGADPTFTIADAIFHLRTEEVRMREIRMFSVGKLRGANHIRGWHTFEITGEGIQIYPRIEALVDHLEIDVANEIPAPAPDEQLRTAVEGLDEMLAGGLARGSLTLVVGTPGSGKTLFGMAFLSAGAEAGEPGLLVGYHETPDVLVDKAEKAGLPIRRGIENGHIHLRWKAPAELLADREGARLLATIEEHGIKRVVIDAIEDLRQAITPRERDLSFLSSLANLLREKGVTTVVMQDMSQVVGTSFDMPMAQLSAMMDNVLHLRYVEQKGTLGRLLAVLKVRSRGHDPSLRQFHITANGLSVGEPYDSSEMVLTGLGLPR